MLKDTVNNVTSANDKGFAIQKISIHLEPGSTQTVEITDPDQLFTS